MTVIERRVWAAWNALGAGELSPVKRIAAELGTSPAAVAAIVYPADVFGPWSDDQEPPSCAWFALCDRPAAGTVEHPILGAVPTCQPCAERHGLRLEP